MEGNEIEAVREETKLRFSLLNSNRIRADSLGMASEYGLFIGGYSNTISALHFHPAARSLSTIYTTPLSLKLAAPTWLVLLGDTLYALQEWGANQFGEGIITAFRIHRPAFSLELINSVRSLDLFPSLPSLIWNARRVQGVCYHVTLS